MAISHHHIVYYRRRAVAVIGLICHTNRSGSPLNDLLPSYVTSLGHFKQRASEIGRT